MVGRGGTGGFAVTDGFSNGLVTVGAGIGRFMSVGAGGRVVVRGGTGVVVSGKARSGRFITWAGRATETGGAGRFITAGDGAGAGDGGGGRFTTMVEGVGEVACLSWSDLLGGSGRFVGESTSTF